MNENKTNDERSNVKSSQSGKVEEQDSQYYL